jgi:hypothetical protein
MLGLFDTKINPDGSFQKVKARSVLRGDMMIKGVHYSIVFTASPTITGNRIIQGLVVHKGLARITGTESLFDRACGDPHTPLNTVGGEDPMCKSRPGSSAQVVMAVNYATTARVRSLNGAVTGNHR